MSIVKNRYPHCSVLVQPKKRKTGQRKITLCCQKSNANTILLNVALGVVVVRVPVPLFPCNKLACSPVPQKLKIYFPNFCFCSPQNLAFVPMFPEINTIFPREGLRGILRALSAPFLRREMGPVFRTVYNFGSIPISDTLMSDVNDKKYTL